jgi:hypothetical protein
MITNHLSDIILLLIMLVGLFRLDFHEAGVSGLGHFMWRQVRLSVLLTSRDVVCPFPNH